ncbi:MAG: N-acetyl-gamma-glutamyl-phosphate reductase [Clostridiales bacterium]|nr:N-acetyl-gamma-glutamyl-phosphate reductase [Clostridiales bacterium]
MKPKIFIDGSEGTTGLQIRSRLAGRGDIELLEINKSLRKDEAARIALMSEADIVILCLPDKAAEEAALLAKNAGARVIDASTAHRTSPGWVYGFPELSSAHRKAIAGAALVANPGCHASGVIALVRPLTESGIMPRDYPLAITSLTGFSGGGKAKIAEYEADDRDIAYDSPRLYALSMQHKHLPEIVTQSGLLKIPAFCPVIADYYSGMQTIIPLHNDLLRRSEDIYEVLRSHYSDSRFIHVTNQPPESGYQESNYAVGTNDMLLTVTGSGEITLLTARFDNLGKGASGAAVQNLNIMLGLQEDAGL